MKNKSLFRGAFNFKQSARVMYAYAFTKKQAWVIFCRRIAERDGVSLSVVMGTFDGSRDNYSIGIEMEVKDDEN